MNIRRNNERGIAMIIAIPILMMIALLGVVAIMNSNTSVETAGSSKRSSQAFYIAEAGLERAVSEYVWGNFYDENVSPFINPFGWLESLNDSTFYNSINLGTEGNYSVRVTSVVNPGPKSPYIDCRDVTIEATSHATGGNESVTLVATMRFGILPASVFDYSYFINHFGWWSGFASGGAVANGNVRANGHFDLLAGYMTVNGNPRFNPVTGDVMDNGGAYAGGYVFPTSGSGYQGMAQYAANRHSYAGADKSEDDRALIEMPNLNDPADLDHDGNVDELNPYYIALANGTLGNPAGKVGIDTNGDGVLQASEVLITGTYGDNVGETGNAALVGTDTNPIIVQGTIAITSNLAIKGTVKGKGSFYVGRNTYVGGQIKYKNVLTARPIFNYGSETPEAFQTRINTWKAANANADMVAFMTTNNIVAGNFTTTTWKSNILNGASGWLADYRNNGYEDIGIDGVFGNLQSQTTPYGASTKEADGRFTVVIADADGNQHMQDLTISGGVAQIPSGYHIVPGTGEDVDGDALYDAPYNYTNDININTTFNSTNFYNLSPSITTYTGFSDASVAKMDGIFYTNHAIAGMFTDACVFNGSVVARNEAMVLTGGHVTLTHDDRLSSNYHDLTVMNIYLPLIKRYSTVSWIDTGIR